MTDNHRQRIMVIGGSSGMGIGVARVALREDTAVLIVSRSASASAAPPRRSGTPRRSTR